MSRTTKFGITNINFVKKGAAFHQCLWLIPSIFDEFLDLSFNCFLCFEMYFHHRIITEVLKAAFSQGMFAKVAVLKAFRVLRALKTMSIVPGEQCFSFFSFPSLP